MLQEVLEVQEGIWIDGQWIRDAGLGHRLQVIVKPGEIRIVRGDLGVEPQMPDRGWDAFRSLGNNAKAGALSDAAKDHDRYLYGKPG